MRLFGVLALAAPFALGTLFLLMPDLAESLVDGQTRLAVASVAAAIAGVTMTAGALYLHSQVKLRRLVQATERIAGGDYTVTVSARGGGLDGRLARSINSISTALADTYDKATMDRLTGVANRQALLGDLFAEVERAGRYERALSVAFVDIDHFKAVNDTYGHAAGDIVLRGVAQAIAANLRASDRIGRYGGEEFMLILTETDVEEGGRPHREAAHARPAPAVRGRRQSGPVGDDLDRDRRRDRSASCAWTRWSATPMRRCTRPSRWDATRRTSSPSRTTTPGCRARRSPRPDAPGRSRSASWRARPRPMSLTSVLSPLPHYRGQPSALIASIVVALARQLELPDAEVDRIRIAALLHDVGKIAVPEEILEKPAALTSAEWRTVVQHPRIGQVILEQAASLKEAVPIILHHHERYGGHGYPYGLRANEIPLGARIVAIADAYDAMTHDRPYKRAMSHENAIEELRRHAGTQFDPELVEPLLRPLCDDRPRTGPDGPRDHRRPGRPRPRPRRPRWSCRSGPRRRSHDLVGASARTPPEPTTVSGTTTAGPVREDHSTSRRSRRSRARPGRPRCGPVGPNGTPSPAESETAGVGPRWSADA